jgi:hypothetical protein
MIGKLCTIAHSSRRVSVNNRVQIHQLQETIAGIKNHIRIKQLIPTNLILFACIQASTEGRI